MKEGVKYQGKNLYTDYQNGADNTGTLYIGLSSTPTFDTVKFDAKPAGTATGTPTVTATLSSEGLNFTGETSFTRYEAGKIGYYKMGNSAPELQSGFSFGNNTITLLGTGANGTAVTNHTK